jgi:hypothetical protein
VEFATEPAAHPGLTSRRGHPIGRIPPPLRAAAPQGRATLTSPCRYGGSARASRSVGTVPPSSSSRSMPANPAPASSR